MAERITDSQAYKTRFSTTSLRRAAYRAALDIRKFEIELYWKRAAYFWTLIAATFAGYFALAKSPSTTDPNLRFLVTCIGLVLSTGWYLVNRGSKYWQQNWERHVDSLEDEFAGPLYKTTISKNQYHWYAISTGYPFSVSRINQYISLFVALLWLGLAVSSFPGVRLHSVSILSGPYVLASLTFGFLMILIFASTSGGSKAKDREVDFDVAALVPSTSLLPGTSTLESQRGGEGQESPRLPVSPGPPVPASKAPTQ